MQNFQFLIKYLKQHKYSLLIVLFALITTSITMLLIGYNFSQIIKIISINENSLKSSSKLNKEIIEINLLIFVFSLGSFIRSYFINKVSLKIQNDIKIDVYKNILSNSYSNFKKIPLAVILSILTKDIKNIGDAIVNFFSFILRNLLMLLGGFILMLSISLRLSFFVIFLFLILAICIRFLSKRLKSISQKSLQEESNILSKLEENLSAMKILHIFYKQKESSKNIELHLSSFLKIDSQRLKFRSFFFSFIIAFALSTLAFTIWIGNKEITIFRINSSETIISFIYYSILVSFSAIGISETLSQTNNYLSSIERVKKYSSTSKYDRLYLEKPLNNLDKLLDLDRNFDIEIKNLNYGYNPEKNILQNIFLKIPQGEFLGIIGFSGSGKSSLINLISRILTGYTGTVKIGGRDLLDIEEKTLRKILLLVCDEDQLFTNTIESNILFNQKYDASELQKIINICDLEDFIENAPLGIKTVLDQKNIKISAGQKQKFLLARAILLKPKILIIDEATNSIDIKGEHTILKNIRKFLPQTTIVYVTHRTSNLFLTDSIVIFNKGKLIESGSQEFLLKNSDLFKKLINQKNII
ncbi:MAG: ABC transporter ATP-binding protein [Rickettsia sp.]|nr:ABC transporter ATP-binding protein [Rickettsia sp.]